MERNSSAADDHFADGIAHGGETLLIFSHDIIAHQILILMEVKGADEQLPAGSFLPPLKQNQREGGYPS